MSNVPLDYLTGTGLTQIATADVNTSQTTTSLTYVDLATVGPSVQVLTGASVMVGISWDGSRTLFNGIGYVAVAVSGATTLAASDTNCARASSRNANTNNSVSSWFTLTGLTPGLNTFTLKYRGDVAGTYRFLKRTLVVVPL